ncbi:MAG: Crp/Fnr family transcriptional regulator [Flavobacterium sp.]|nr:MAG: Crp/Fnr family transcriptional regulator [Flavobacterium sp.]
MIDCEILKRFSAQKKHFAKGEHLFREHGRALHYFQVASGEVKMYNFNDDGKEFIQGMFMANDSFGEPPLLNGKPYLTNAVATIDSEVWLLAKADFLAMLSQFPETSLAVCTRLADRLYYKSMMSMEISSEEPEHRLLRFFDFLKHDVAHVEAGRPYLIELTRQELADLTGLRVETVIRAVKALEKKKEVQIKDRKIFR